VTAIVNGKGAQIAGEARVGRLNFYSVVDGRTPGPMPTIHKAALVC
jgi:hypothetical protein